MSSKNANKLRSQHDQIFYYVQIKKVIYVKVCILNRINNRHPLKF